MVCFTDFADVFVYNVYFVQKNMFRLDDINILCYS